MKKIICVLFLLISYYAHAAIYTHGVDFNTVTELNALVLTSGDIVTINSTLEGTIIVNSNGITYTGSGLVSGLKTATFSNYSGNVYYSVIESGLNLNMVTVDNIQYAKGRTPDEGTFYTYETSSTNVSITDNELSSTPDWTGAQVVIQKNDYTVDVCNVNSQVSGTITYTSLGTTRDAESNKYYFFQNDIRTLSVNYEWYYSNDTLYMYFDHIPTETVRYAAYDNLLVCNGYDNLTVNGLDFTGSNDNAIEISNSDNSIITNSIITFAGKDGINATGNDIELSGDSIQFCNGGGIYLDSDTGLINNCYISDIGLHWGQTNAIVACMGITNQGTEFDITNCEINNVAYDGIYIHSDAVSGLINSNKIDSTCMINDDAGSIYFAYDHNGMEISNNIITNSQANGIYLDNYCHNATVNDNTILYTEDNAIKIHRGHENTITDNTIHDAYAGVMLFNSVYVDTIYDNDVNNNIICLETTSQFFYRATSYVNNISTMMISDSNYFFRKIDLDESIYVNQPDLGGFQKYDLIGWQTFSGDDLHSTANVKDEFDIRVNTSFTDTITLSNDSIYTLADGTTQIGGTILPMSSEVFVNVSKYTPQKINSVLGGYYDGYINAGYYGGSIIGYKK